MPYYIKLQKLIFKKNKNKTKLPLCRTVTFRGLHYSPHECQIRISILQQISLIMLLNIVFK